LEVHRIGGGTRQRGIQRGADEDVAADGVGQYQREDARSQCIHVHVLELQLALAQQGPQATHDVVGAQIILSDIFEDLAHQGHIRLGLAQEQVGGFDVAEDGAQRLRDLVGHRCRYFAYQGQPGRMGDFRILTLYVGAGARVAPVLHQQCDDEDRLHSQQCARQVLQRIDGRRSLSFRTTLGRPEAAPNT
jgi:hypothetical protein